MKSLQIQIQFNRVADLNGEQTVNRLRSFAKTTAATVRVSKGTDKKGYIDVRFLTEDLCALWAILRKELRTNAPLAGCSIVVCQGEAGWDDYLLLHHFDSAQSLDRLPRKTKKRSA